MGGGANVGNNLKDNLTQLPYFADKKVQPQMSKGPSCGVEQSLK